MLVASILLIIPSSGLAVLANLAGLYGLYVMYEGFGIMKNTPEDKKMPYFFTSLGCLIVAYVFPCLIFLLLKILFLLQYWFHYTRCLL